MLDAVKHLYRSNNQLRLQVVEMLHLCRGSCYTQNEKQMLQKHKFLSLLVTLNFCLAGSEQSVVNAQSTIATTAKPNPRRTEVQTLKQGIARRRQGESDTSFLRRVLPVSYHCTDTNPCPYNSHRISYVWRSTSFGKQLFFSNPNGGNGHELVLFVLDPFQTNTYAVQAFNMGQMGDLTVLKAIFFADVNQDGRKELLALNECDLREASMDRGEVLLGLVPHYETHVIQFVGLTGNGRPQYREDKTPRSYLNELPTATAVRQAIIKHQQKPVNRKLPPKLLK